MKTLKQEMNEAIRTIALQQGLILSTHQRKEIRRRLFKQYKQNLKKKSATTTDS